MRYRWPAVGAVVALVLLAAVVARGTSAVPVGQGRPLFGFLSWPRLEFPAADGDSYRSPDSGQSGWIDVTGWIVLLLPLVLLGGVILAAAVVGLKGLRLRRIGPPVPVVPGEEPGTGGTSAGELLHAARQAREILAARQGGAPSDAVIAAWVRLERAGAGAGVRRLAHQTPTEFTDALLARHESARAALDRLRLLYQRARFATAATVGAAEADAARAALDEIVRALSGEPVSS
jgi:hypothetical protein